MTFEEKILSARQSRPSGMTDDQWGAYCAGYKAAIHTAAGIAKEADEAIEIALIYLEDGAPNTAADRLRAVSGEERQ